MIVSANLVEEDEAHIRVISVTAEAVARTLAAYIPALSAAEAADQDFDGGLRSRMRTQVDVLVRMLDSAISEYDRAL